jgi:uncharacterized membrane protein YkoI
MTIFSRTATSLSAVLFVLGGILAQASWAGDEGDHAALLQALGKSKLSLADGLKQSTKGAEIPISAKFELDDNKQLSLSVYTAEKGLGVDAEHNALKEFAGSPEQSAWTPAAEVFKDLPHVARASQHLAISALAKHSLADVVARAQKGHAGTVFAITPAIHNKKAVFEILIADKGKVTEYLYDALTGAQLAKKK